MPVSPRSGAGPVEPRYRGTANPMDGLSTAGRASVPLLSRRRVGLSIGPAVVGPSWPVWGASRTMLVGRSHARPFEDSPDLHAIPGLAGAGDVTFLIQPVGNHPMR
jgi:hypothetical protein